METEKQNKYRTELIAKYESRAFECLALYNYYGRQFKTIDDGCEKLDVQKKECEKLLSDLESQPGSKENYEKIKALKDDIKAYDSRIEKVGELGKKFFEKATAYQEEGGRILEQIEEFKVFTLKTPEQIAADKAPKVEEQLPQTNA